MPRYVSLVEGDNLLTIDLSCPLSIEAGAAVIRRQKHALLVECLPSPDESIVRGPDGGYHHEFVLPLLVDQPAARSEGATEPAPRSWRHRRAHTPGGKWLYAKIYASPPAAEELLLDIVAPFLETALRDSLVKKWFFIRYRDPGEHIRVRLYGDPARMTRPMIEGLHDLLDPLVRCGMCDRWMVDTYLPETARYGGEELIGASEDLFCLDSEATVRMLRSVRADGTMERRWNAAVLSVGAILSDWRLPSAEARRFARAAADALEGRLTVASHVARAAVARHYRANRALLEALVRERSAAPVEERLEEVWTAARQRSARSEAIVGRLRTAMTRSSEQQRTALLRSHVHMHVNRLFQEALPLHEYLLYELVGRAYAAAGARETVGPPTISATVQSVVHSR